MVQRLSVVNGAAIRARREALQLTMDEAAKRSGFGDRQHWNKIESGLTGNPSVGTVLAVAQTLMCRVEDIVHMPKTKPPRRRPA
jgi:transcriptional regulator with XRE-family HTH domain